MRRHIEAARGGELRIAQSPVLADARLFALAVGKAAAPMARALEATVGERIAAGLAVVPDGHGLDLEIFETLEAAHPVPDLRCERAARRAQALVEAATPNDVLVVLLSGGASSLFACPAAGLELDDVASTTRKLLEAGAAIDELNAVRKHLSDVAGGRLALRTRAARVEVLAISDVPGDRFDIIGSGPFAGDPTSFRDALEIIDRCDVRAHLPERVIEHLEAGARSDRDETPEPGDARLAHVRHTLIASNATALDAAQRAASALGVRALRVTGALSGEARVAGKRLAALCLAVRADGPVCLLAGGETVVHVTGGGRGGRNQELALGAAIALDGVPDIAVLAAGTDGLDGPTDAAGAYADGGTVTRGRAAGIDADASLENNDAYGFFSVEGGILRTGPTRTNVMDLAFACAR